MMDTLGKVKDVEPRVLALLGGGIRIRPDASGKVVVDIDQPTMSALNTLLIEYKLTSFALQSHMEDTAPLIATCKQIQQAADASRTTVGEMYRGAVNGVANLFG